MLLAVTLGETSLVWRAVHDALVAHERVVLAVSGGLDSMVLLDAAAAVVPADRLTVATFDHGTGPAATSARRLVQQRCIELGLGCSSARAAEPLASEEAFRDARWAFLRRIALSTRGVVATAHTASDQVETVLMRVLRDASARGLAGLYARSDVIRPLLRFDRRELEDYSRARGVSWVDDPSNASRKFFRNRIRHDLLPALRRARPSIDADLLATARSAAHWRDDVDAYIDGALELRVIAGGRGLDVTASSLVAHSTDALALLWPAIAARAGVTLDRRGILRLAEFSKRGRVGARMPLSGRWEVVRSRDALQLRQSDECTPETVPLASSGVRWGDWTFRLTDGPAEDSAWSAWLPIDGQLSVRRWRSGDTMKARPGSPAGKVKRFLSKAGVTGHDRTGWPVVLQGDQIVWIPGVRRSDAAAARSGRPGLPFICEHYRR